MQSEFNQPPQTAAANPAPRKPAQTPHRQGSFKSIVFNILIPVLLLTQGDRITDQAAVVLITALAFPLGFFIWEFAQFRKANYISILGFVSVLLTGGVGLLQLPRFWFIIKEAAIPLLIGLAVLGSLFSRYPLIRALVYSKEIFDVEKIQHALNERGTASAMERLLRKATAFLAASFFFSAVLNYILASHFVKTEPSVDPAQFNAEVGAMTGWSFVVIALPSMLFMGIIIYSVVRGIHRYAGLKMEDAMAAHLRDEAAKN